MVQAVKGMSSATPGDQTLSCFYQIDEVHTRTANISISVLKPSSLSWSLGKTFPTADNVEKWYQYQVLDQWKTALSTRCVFRNSSGKKNNVTVATLLSSELFDRNAPKLKITAVNVPIHTKCSFNDDMYAIK